LGWWEEPTVLNIEGPAQLAAAKPKRDTPCWCWAPRLGKRGLSGVWLTAVVYCDWYDTVLLVGH
jgi:hypothetical protein